MRQRIDFKEKISYNYFLFKVSVYFICDFSLVGQASV